MPINRDEVQRIAALASLELDPERLETLREQLQSILDYVALLDGVEVAATEACPGSVDAPAALRGDEERESLTVEQALRNAPDAAASHFRVPRVLGE